MHDQTLHSLAILKELTNLDLTRVILALVDHAGIRYDEIGDVPAEIAAQKILSGIKRKEQWRNRI